MENYLKIAALFEAQTPACLRPWANEVSSCIEGGAIFLVIANVETRIFAEIFMKQETNLER